MNNRAVKNWLFGLIGGLMGIWIAWQLNAMEVAGERFNRENRLNTFKEIQVVKKSNQALNETIIELERELANTNDSERAMQSLRDDIKKNKILAGSVAVAGPGLEIRISGVLEPLWFTDAVNDLFSAGAEAVSVNGMRFGGEQEGFDKMPNGRILFGGEILDEPYLIRAIGKRSVLEEAITQEAGLVDRIQKSVKNIEITVKSLEEIRMAAGRKVVSE